MMKLVLFLLLCTVLSVPISSVSIRPQSEPLIENKDGIFVCEIKESNPEASFEWIILHKNGSSLKIQQNYTTINKTQTKSILRLKLKRVYQKIICRATIKDRPWIHSDPQSLDIHYSPEIAIRHHVTNLQYRAKITCEADSNPDDIHYKMVQKWGETVRKEILTNHLDFKCFSFNDFGHWICQASNGVPNKDYYSEESIDIKVNVSAQFSGKTDEIATVESVKELKRCFYCNPEATDVKWYKGNEEMPSDRIYNVPAEDDQFPFPGRCSILKLDVAEKDVQVYYLQVINPVGNGTLKLTLGADIKASSSSIIYMIVGCIGAAFLIIFIFIGICYFKFYKPSRNSAYDVTESSEKPSEGVISEGGAAQGQDNGTEHQYVEMVGQPTITD